MPFFNIFLAVAFIGFVCAIAWTIVSFLERHTQLGVIPMALGSLLQGITVIGVLGGVLAGGIWKGQIQTTLDGHTKTLDQISTAINDGTTGLNVRTAKIETTASALEKWTQKITPEIIHADYERELNRLNTKIEELQKELAKVSDELQKAKADLGKARKQS